MVGFRVKMIILPIAFCRYSAIPIRILGHIFRDLERTVFSFVWKQKKPKIVKTVSNNERTAGGTTTPDFRMGRRGMALTQGRPIDQQTS